jgi:hypothetical protein
MMFPIFLLCSVAQGNRLGRRFVLDVHTDVGHLTDSGELAQKINCGLVHFSDEFWSHLRLPTLPARPQYHYGMVQVCREGGPDATGDGALPYSKEPTTENCGVHARLNDEIHVTDSGGFEPPEALC